jgi:hypothetical protein
MTAIPQGYDPITLNQYLWFYYKCFTCPPTEFQNLFENIVKKTRPEFMRIRPYGRDGDRKCDGLFEADGHFFQVYSPDELTQANLVSKIEADLAGAVESWTDKLISWTFVYNTRIGLPPDVPAAIEVQRKKYPQLILDSLSKDALWEMTRSLTLQQRAEILGAPNGYGHLFLSPRATSEEIRQAIKNGWFVIVHDTMTPINVRDVVEAMKPMSSFGLPFYVRPKVGELPWVEAAAFQKAITQDAIEKSRDVIPRFAVFSLSQIALCIHLGFILSDRLEVRYFQFDRDHRTWEWPESPDKVDIDLTITGLPEDLVDDPAEVIVRISLSAKISPTASCQSAGPAPVQIDISVSEPDVMWLKSEHQLLALGRKFRSVLATIRNKIPNCPRIHLFYAGPTGGAIIVGQQINPRMNPAVELYEYSQQSVPQHRNVLTLRNEP